MFGIFMLRCNLIPKKTRYLCMCMGNEGLFLGQFQFEMIAQELSELALDVFCFFPWSSKSKQCVIRISHIAESPVIGVGGITSWQLLHLFEQCFCLPDTDAFGAHRSQDWFSSLFP